MLDVLIKILPVYLLFFTGVVLKHLKVISQENAEFILKIVFYVTLPALIIKSLSNVNLDLNVVILPLGSAMIIFSTYFITRLYVKLKKMPHSKSGVLYSGTMILNIGFLIPFIHSVYGDYGLSLLLLFDFSNAILAYSFVYAIAIKHGKNGSQKAEIRKKLIGSPPLWAIIVAVLFNVFSMNIPSFILPFFEITGNMTIPLLLIAVGVFFKPGFHMFSNIFSGILLRMGVGILIGLILIKIFNIEGIKKIIVIAGASAPAGFNTLTFASLENLDKDYAALLVSFSILVSMVIIPLILYFA